MNEQLVVKNFGPIKEATVDFKRVTVFIGPTGGGKSTLAKLAAVFRNKKYLSEIASLRKTYFDNFALGSFFTQNTVLGWNDETNNILTDSSLEFSVNTDIFASSVDKALTKFRLTQTELQLALKLLLNRARETDTSIVTIKNQELLKNFVESEDSRLANILKLFTGIDSELLSVSGKYFPSERIFVPSIEYSWAGLMRDDIGLPKTLLEFSNSFSLSRKEILELEIPFFNVKYLHIDGRDFIKVPEREEPLMLLETASGIQSVTPLLVLLEHLSRNTEQAQSFIIEEPELNLFPTAQFELVKILVEKCARLDGQNDLVLTTHSPYVLTALNILCYAFRIAQQDEATARKVAKLIPRHCWIDPEQFAAYYVDRPSTKRKQQVRSIINKKTGLIEENELDTASEELGELFDKLTRLRKPANASPRA